VRETSLAALRRGLAVQLARGAHATYDEGAQTAAEISAAIEAELAQAGARIVDPGDGPAGAARVRGILPFRGR
jgi:hypothetical protein